MKTVICPELRKGRAFPRLVCPGLLLSLLLLPTLSSPMSLAAPNSSKDKEKEKPYALIAGTVWGPDNHPVYGISVKIRRATDKPKKVRWQLYSDHMGEFAQRVPAGEADYIIWADLKGVKSTDGKPVRLAQPVTVHIYNDEREDTGLHLTH
ncbi:MAG TPA: hypothetical protein VH350_15240 [Candidatus Sulfotelmatobacter sp.]|nr:hypothetical protein [Candidatus Sulfotelmatobacter sp.]